LETPKEVQTLGDGEDCQVVPGVWKPPPVVTEPMILECRRWLEALNKCDATAQDGRIRVWLSRLLFGLSGNHSEDMIRGKLSSFAFALADKPAFCFDDDTLRRAQKHFKSFWPSAGELIEFMEGIEGEIRVKAQRAWKIIDDGPRKAGAPPTRRPWAEGGSEDCERWNREEDDAKRKELAAMVEARYGKPPPAPARLPGEDEKAYVARLCRHMNAELDQATKQMKGGLRARPKGPDKPAPPPTPEAMKAAYDTTGIKARDVRETVGAEESS
jgi:hypothetical protein